MDITRFGVQYDQFEVVSRLGSGSFGTVWKMIWRTPLGDVIPVALKRVSMQPSQEYAERNIVACCSHKNIVYVYDSFYSYNAEGVGHLNLIFEFVPGWSLFDALKQMSGAMKRERTLDITFQLLNALNYLHAQKIAHRDLKPANIMLRPDGLVKIIDFGAAKFIKEESGGQEEHSACYCVSRYYRAPELLLGNSHYGWKVDIWSLGCILAELLIGTPIFPGDDSNDQMLRIISILGPPTREDVQELAPHVDDISLLLNSKEASIDSIPFSNIVPEDPVDFADLLSHMLVYNPKKRWSASQLLKHHVFHIQSNS